MRNVATLYGIQELCITFRFWENPANFYTMSNFTVKITRNGQTVQYTGCEWTAIEEETRRPLIWLRATLMAKARTEVTGDEAAAE